MKRLLLGAALAAMAVPALAQSTMTLDDLDLKPKAPVAAKPAGSSSEMEKCLLDQASCQNAEFKSSASFSVDDVVNLGIIDREEVKPAALGEAGMAGASGGASAAMTLPSIDMEILFDYDSATLRPDQYAKLVQLSEILKGDKFSAFRFLFLGHSDAKGDPDYNRNLSQKRAEAVSAFVEGISGLSGGRLAATGLGATKLKDAGDPFGAQNRRVQLVLIPVK
ncbi:MAG TPA: OmpA family protein [Hyphomicrobiales bacterium]|nr:OmpA family protein [Kaistiaceae bacterium]HQF30679.1 OmpA family protein [Hyphomicrobiales bacterium]